MKRILLLTAILIGTATAVKAQTARLQVIHNCADPAADTVDVWIKSTPTGVVQLLNNFPFRHQSGFVDAPAGTNLRVYVAPKDSDDTLDALVKFDFNLASGGSYIVTANGHVLGGFDPQKNFELTAFSGAREAATNPSKVDVLVLHGSTDAPTVDIVAPGAGTLVDNLAYCSYAGYLSLDEADYRIQVRDASGQNVVAEYAAPLQTLNLEGTALTVVASGFLDPSSNKNGSSFGLFVATAAAGEMLELPSVAISTTRVQAIHNSPDPAVASVDVYLNDRRILDNFNFRSASPFIDAPAGTPFRLIFAPSTSTDTTSKLVGYTYTLDASKKYILVASGTVASTGYNPYKGFEVLVYDNAREVSNDQNQVDVLVLHGSTDAPTVDIVAPGIATLVNNISYGSFSNGYLNLDEANYQIQVRDDKGQNVAAEYSAPLQTLNLEGNAITVLASGFIDPLENNNGVDFGLFVALASGGQLVELPSVDISTTRVQAIHNSPDPAVASVDVYLNDRRILDNFSFRTASPFIDAPAGTPFRLIFAPSTSTDTTSKLVGYTYALSNEEKYVLVASGTVGSTGYNPYKPFEVLVFAGAQEEAEESNETDLLVVHGSTDAPAVDIYARNVAQLVDSINYGEIDGYLSVPTNDYIIDIAPANGNYIAAFTAPLQTLNAQGAALVVLASGFLNPQNNNAGPGFGLYAALPTGGALIPLPSAQVNAVKNLANSVVKIYPNPSFGEIQVDRIGAFTAEVKDLNGRILLRQEGANSLKLDLQNLSNGVYMISTVAADGISMHKVAIQR